VIIEQILLTNDIKPSWASEGWICLKCSVLLENLPLLGFYVNVNVPRRGRLCPDITSHARTRRGNQPTDG